MRIGGDSTEDIPESLDLGVLHIMSLVELLFIS